MSVRGSSDDGGVMRKRRSKCRFKEAWRLGWGMLTLEGDGCVGGKGKGLVSKI